MKPFQWGKLPTTPGIYIWKRGRKILYIGRATNLRNRVRSYFDRDIGEKRSGLIERMVEEATSIKTIPTDSVLESILLEAYLIKKHQPPANTDEKSDKSFIYVLITKEEFPRVLLVRERELLSGVYPSHTIKYQFGPFLNATIVKGALSIVRKIFPFRDSCKPLSGKPCFNRQIGLCPGVCTGEISAHHYARTVRHMKLFFEGKKKMVVQELARQMKKAAKNRHFEEAAQIKKTLSALTHINDIALMKRDVLVERGTPSMRIEGYDVAHLRGGAHIGVMTVVQNGEKSTSDYRTFNIKSVSDANDPAALEEILSRRLAHPEWPYPRLIVVDGGKIQLARAEKTLKDAGVSIPVVSVVKDERHKPKNILGDISYRKAHENAILLANAEAHRFAIGRHRWKQRKNALKIMR